MTQLYYQVYINFQLHVSANAAAAIIRLDTIYQRSYIDITQNKYQRFCWERWCGRHSDGFRRHVPCEYRASQLCLNMSLFSGDVTPA